jgi:homocysteine S-methyltransferase
VGGCCGTTPDHIKQIKAAVAAAVPSRGRTVATAPAAAAAPMTPVARRERSRLARALAEGEFAVVAEIATPRGLDLSTTVARARRLHDLGAVAVNVPDYPRSGARASALALTMLTEQQAHVETLLHYCCRDRNLVGMQTELVGAHAMGLRNILLTTGNPPQQGAYADAASSFDVDSIGLTNLAVRLNQGLDIGGQPIGAPTRFHIGAAVNPFTPDADIEWRRLEHKVAAGAEFLMTPPILDIAAFDAVLPRLKATGLPILAGVVALEGVRHAEFMSSEVVGVRVGESVMERLRAASDERAAAVAITIDIVAALRTRVQGIHVTGVHGSPESVERMLAELHLPTLRPLTP